MFHAHLRSGFLLSKATWKLLHKITAFLFFFIFFSDFIYLFLLYNHVDVWQNHSISDVVTVPFCLLPGSEIYLLPFFFFSSSLWKNTFLLTTYSKFRGRFFSWLCLRRFSGSKVFGGSVILLILGFFTLCRILFCQLLLCVWLQGQCIDRAGKLAPKWRTYNF